MLIYFFATAICVSVFLYFFSSVPNLIRQYKVTESGEIDISYIFQKILLASLIYVICFCACAYLFKIVFNLNRNTNFLLNVIGVSKVGIVLICLSETAILTFSSSAVAILINIILVLSNYNAIDYLIAASISAILSVITTIPFFVGYMRNPLITYKTHYSLRR